VVSAEAPPVVVVVVAGLGEVGRENALGRDIEAEVVLVVMGGEVWNKRHTPNAGVSLAFLPFAVVTD
jgi:hypothetical protein